MPARSRLLPLLVSAALLASCSTPDDAPSRTVTTAAAAGADAPSGTVVEEKTAVIELGEFDAEDDGFVLFDPCTEIPREVLDEAGFGDMVSDPSYLPTGSVLCSFWTQAEDTGWEFVALVADEIPQEHLMDLGFILSEDVPTNVPGVYFHHMGEDTEKTCTAAVETTRGRWSVEFKAGQMAPERKEICALATDYLETIYFQLRE